MGNCDQSKYWQADVTKIYWRSFPEQLKLNKIELLPIEIQHLKAMSTLPFHHRDPFDRLIIAQAMVEDIGIVSVDKVFGQYDVDLIR